MESVDHSMLAVGSCDVMVGYGPEIQERAVRNTTPHSERGHFQGDSNYLESRWPRIPGYFLGYFRVWWLWATCLSK